MGLFGKGKKDASNEEYNYIEQYLGKEQPETRYAGQNNAGSGISSFHSQEPEQAIMGDLKPTVFGTYTKKSVEDYIKKSNENLNIMKTQMEAQLRDLFKEKTNVVRECEVLRMQLGKAETSLEELKSSIEEDSSSREREITEAVAEISRLKQVIEEYQEREKDVDEAAKEITRLQKIVEEYQEREEDINGAFEEISKLQETLRDYQEKELETDALKLKIKEKNNRISVLTEQIEEYKAGIATLQGKVKDLVKQKDKLREMYESGERAEGEDSAELLKELNLLKEREREYKSKLAEHESRIAEYEAKLVEHESQLIESEGGSKKLEEKEEEIRRLKEDIEKYKRVFSEMEEEKKRFVNRNSQEQIDKLVWSERELADKQNLVEVLKKNIADKERILNKMQDMLSKTSQDSKSFENRINELYENYSLADRKIKQLERESREKDFLISQYQSSDIENKLLKQRYDQAKITIKSLKETIQEIMYQMEQQSENLKRYVESSANDRTTINEISAELTEIKLNNIELLDALNKMTINYENALKENKKLELKLEETENRLKIYPISYSMKEDEKKTADSMQERVQDREHDIAYKKAKELVEKFNEILKDEGEIIV